MNTLIIIAVVSAIGISGAGAAYETGYLPITDLMDVEEPIGYEHISIEKYERQYAYIVSEIPNYDKIKKEAFKSEYTQLEIYLDYKQRLENQGFSEKMSGSNTIEDKTVFYVGYLKGLTAVAIAITPGDDVNQDCESVVLYTTGNALDYKEILEWYQCQC